MILKKKLNFAKFEVFNTKKLSASSDNLTYTVGLNGETLTGDPDIMWLSICFIKDTQLIWAGGLIYSSSNDLSDYNNDANFITCDEISDKTDYADLF